MRKVTQGNGWEVLLGAVAHWVLFADSMLLGPPVLLHRPAVTCGPQSGWCCSRALSILGKWKQIMHSLLSCSKAKWHGVLFLISGVDSWQCCSCVWNNCPDFASVDADKCTWNYRRLLPLSCTSFWKHLQVLVALFSFFGWTTLNRSYCCGFQGVFFFLKYLACSQCHQEVRRYECEKD